MNQIIVSNLDEGTIAKLRLLADRHGRSLSDFEPETLALKSPRMGGWGAEAPNNEAK
ncbi:FitA-like ribbon-helix-helix domain-containing protein [Phormidesmis priestleyi]